MSRIRNFCAAVLVALLPFFSSPAGAVINAMDAVPGSTILYPYFEVDLANTNGSTTLLSLVNTSATAILGNVTVWTDRGIPVHTFPIYLTGYDIATWSMRDVLNGVRPSSASDGQDFTDTLSPQGPISQDINFASCTGTLPLTTLGAGVRADIRAALTGTAVTSLPGITGGTCVGNAYGDQIARGYVTVDTVNNCAAGNPASPSFSSDVTSQNVLWGDYMQVNPAAGTAYSGLATMIESATGSPPFQPFVAGAYTFYGRFNGFSATDQREALASRWLIHGDTDVTQIVAWRDPKTTTGIAGATCGTTPAPLVTEYASALWFDSDIVDVTPGAVFSSVLNKRSMTSAAPFNMPATKKLGFLSLGLNHTVAGVPTVPKQSVAQSMVFVTRQPRVGGLLGSRAIAFPLDQVESPSGGFAHSLNF